MFGIFTGLGALGDVKRKKYKGYLTVNDFSLFTEAVAEKLNERFADLEKMINENSRTQDIDRKGAQCAIDVAYIGIKELKKTLEELKDIPEKMNGISELSGEFAINTVKVMNELKDGFIENASDIESIRAVLKYLEGRVNEIPDIRPIKNRCDQLEKTLCQHRAVIEGIMAACRKGEMSMVDSFVVEQMRTWCGEGE